MVKAVDINGVEIKKGDLVKIVGVPRSTHAWLRVGNTLRVTSWDDRSFGNNADYIVVFLKSKKNGRHCQQGVVDKCLSVVEN